MKTHNADDNGEGGLPEENEVQSLLEAASAFETLGLSKEAFDHYREAVAKSPSNPAACARLVFSLTKRGCFDEARAIAQRVIAVNPTTELLDNAALAYHLDGRSKEALELLTRFSNLLERNRSYSWATVAARAGACEVATQHFLNVVQGKASYGLSSNEWVLLDDDVVRWLDQVETHPLSVNAIEVLANPQLERRWDNLPRWNLPCGVDYLVWQLVPAEFRRYLKREESSGFFEWDYRAPCELRSDFIRWQRERIERSFHRFKRLFRRAKAELEALQLPWAEEAARKGRVLAARWHASVAIYESPQVIHRARELLAQHHPGFARDLQVIAQLDEGQVRCLFERWLPRAQMSIDCREELEAVEMLPQEVQETGVVHHLKAINYERLGRLRLAVSHCAGVIRRWPQEASGYVNGANLCLRLKAWHEFDPLVEAAQRVDENLIHVRALQEIKSSRDFERWSFLRVSEFYGQRDLGGLLLGKGQSLESNGEE